MFGWIVLIVFSIAAWLLWESDKNGWALMSLIGVIVGIMMILSIGPFKWPGYTNPEQAINFAAKRDQFNITLYTVDDVGGAGPTAGNAIYILENTHKKGYVFKHDGKYFYLLERVTYIDNVDDPTSKYSYAVDAIPVDQKGDIPGDYRSVNIQEYTGGHAKEAVGLKYSDLPF
ncbi:hypothetical protein [Lactiplantibacillus plantarum]|uniref:hypothetical protein n=1 Tax=Lactiplantibacillus plantarum TaxID=1590 RepID=UPI002551A6D7|nr:hypothetical protein [Lactiplantibacillus plantarum]